MPSDQRPDLRYDPATRLLTSVYCARCGYGLKLQPKVGRCVECGNPYDAREYAMTGVLRTEDGRFPTSTLAVAGACFVTAWILFRAGVLPLAGWPLASAAVALLPRSINR